MGNHERPFDLGGLAHAAPVPLAHVAPFSLGELTVEPAMRRIVAPGGAGEAIEPLMMQVLVAFASAQGATLSRDDLIACCWDGRIVSDDAINRVISRLRRVLETLSGGGVRLETMPKVGYRLRVGDAAAADARPAPSPARSVRLAMAMAALVALIGVGWLATRDAARAEVTTIRIEPVSSSRADRAAQRFASELTSDFARLASVMSNVEIIDPEMAGDADGEGFVMRISVRQEPDRIGAQARLVSGADGTVLWSRAFRGLASAPAALRESVAISAAGVMRCGMERSAARLAEDTVTLRLLFSTCDAIEDEDWPRAHTLARQMVDRRPDIAAGWACLAMTVLLANEADGATSTEIAAQRYARKALALDPHAGRAYVALANAGGDSVIDPNTLATLEQGIEADPDLPSLHSAYAGALFNAGYVRASVAPAQRALALDPASPKRHASTIRRLLGAGRVGEAFATQAKGEQYMASHPAIIEQRARMELLYGDPRAALRRIERGDPTVLKLPPLSHGVIAARVDPATIDRAALERQAEALFAEAPELGWPIAAALAEIGEVERALVWLGRAPRRDAHSQWAFVFRPEAAALRRDPRFFAAMDELGLTRVWRARGQWPDFCSEPGLRYDCPGEAARLAGLRRAGTAAG